MWMRVRNVEEKNVDQLSRIIALLAVTTLLTVSQLPTPVSAQQGHSTNLEINLPEVVAAVKAAHDRYNDASLSSIQLSTMTTGQFGSDKLTWNTATMK
jgi:hypothetical protein